MSLRGRSILLALLCCGAVSLPAAAGIAPYVRVDFGGNALDLPQVNAEVRAAEEEFLYSGLLLDLKEPGPALGPSGSAGLWLFPGFRVGASWSNTRSKVDNRFEPDETFSYADVYEFRMQDVGAEAAVRIPRLGGLTFGGSVARTRAEMSERFQLLNVHGQYYESQAVRKTGRTYGGYVGFDQTNESGIAGYVRLGFQRRDLGTVTAPMTVTDNGTTTVDGTPTFSLDYSGWYVKLGVGFDLVR